METIFASINERKLINRGFLTGFFCPIYGFGAILIVQSSKWVTVVFEDYSTSLFISILFSILLVTALEYITGFALEKVFNCKWWDYSDNAMNLKGYICLKYSLLWGILAFFGTGGTSCSFRIGFFRTCVNEGLYCNVYDPVLPGGYLKVGI